MSKTNQSVMKSFEQVLNVENEAGCTHVSVDSLFSSDQHFWE